MRGDAENGLSQASSAGEWQAGDPKHHALGVPVTTTPLPVLWQRSKVPKARRAVTGHHPHLQNNFGAATWEQIPRQGQEQLPRQGQEQRGGLGCPVPATPFLHRESCSRCSLSHRCCPWRGRIHSLGSPFPVPTAPFQTRYGGQPGAGPAQHTVPRRRANSKTGQTAEGEKPGSSESF